MAWTVPNRQQAYAAILHAICEDEMGEPMSMAWAAVEALEALGVKFEEN